MTVTDKNVKVEINYINDKVMKIHDDPDMPVCQARMGKPAPNFKVLEVLEVKKPNESTFSQHFHFPIYRPSPRAE